MKTTWKSLPLVVSKGPGPPWTSEDHVDHPVTKGRGMKVTQLVEERAFGSIESEVEGVKPHLCLESWLLARVNWSPQGWCGRDAKPASHRLVQWVKNGADSLAWGIQQVSKSSLFNFLDELRAQESSLTLIKSREERRHWVVESGWKSVLMTADSTLTWIPLVNRGNVLKQRLLSDQTHLWIIEQYSCWSSQQFIRLGLHF